MKKGKKQRSGWQIFFLVLEILLLAVLIPALVVTISLIIKYRSTSYEYQKPVVREEEYVLPEYPEIVIDTEGTWQEGLDQEPEVTSEESVKEESSPEPISTEAVSESTTEPEQPEAVSESAKESALPEPVSKSATEAESPEVVSEPASEPEQLAKAVDALAQEQPQKPKEALPNTVNTPARANTPAMNTGASFANSQNAVSVYGNEPIYKMARKNDDVQNILVMGTDTRDVTQDRGRSDTMIVVSYNKKTGSVKLTSLLRDSLVPIEGHGWNRINTAYFYGGVGLAINTVNQLYGLDIQDFIVIDLNGVKSFLDYVGGVDVYL